MLFKPLFETFLLFRKVVKFEPIFPEIEADSDDDGVTLSERKEEREEKHGEKVPSFLLNAQFQNSVLNDCIAVRE